MDEADRNQTVDTEEIVGGCGGGGGSGGGGGGSGRGGDSTSSAAPVSTSSPQQPALLMERAHPNSAKMRYGNTVFEYTKSLLARFSSSYIIQGVHARLRIMGHHVYICKKKRIHERLKKTERAFSFLSLVFIKLVLMGECDYLTD